MFGLFKSDPKKKLQDEYNALLKKAMDAQRGGDIRTYSELSEKADKLYQELQKMT